LWIDRSPTSVIEPEGARRDYIISGGDDIILTLDAQVDSGAITFYCYWSALSTGASVVAA